MRGSASKLLLVSALAVAGCGPLDGFRTAREVSARYGRYEGDIRSLSLLEQRGATPAIRNAARGYRLAVAGHSAALVVDSAVEFSARHGGTDEGKLRGLESVLANQEIARSKLLLAAQDGPAGYRSASLSCLHDYGQCVEQDQDVPLACNSRLLSCLADRLTESATPRGVSDI
jgi:hypothetical protein